ncbi:hypothetical protein BIW11_02791 [Tropilaelaps mercedesae]|uniref:Uncharacterized protein n=1 Tax=Tropilaelaps mercedesae TaxID=418985 RepID=A0A1V9XX90_9ACAR|nr:hypothetical protein BIW11_02791 [Tropilaelaps mercedesae]
MLSAMFHLNLLEEFMAAMNEQAALLINISLKKGKQPIEIYDYVAKSSTVTANGPSVAKTHKAQVSRVRHEGDAPTISFDALHRLQGRRPTAVAISTQTTQGLTLLDELKLTQLYLLFFGKRHKFALRESSLDNAFLKVSDDSCTSGADGCCS